MKVMAIGTVMVDVMSVGLAAVAQPGEVVYTTVDTEIGGHPIDVAIDLIRLGHDPDSVAVVAAVGTGLFGNHARGIMADYGMRTFLQDVDSVDTGRNLVLSVMGEDRRFHLDPGANWWLEADHVISAASSWEPDFVTIRPGYTGIDLALEEIVGAMREACVLLDMMQPHPDRSPGYLDGALQHVDVIHCNRNEAMINARTSTLEDAVEWFLGEGPRLVLITDGDGGATAYTSDWQVAQGPFDVDVVDATGCGDAFCAGVIEWFERVGIDDLRSLDPGRLGELLLHAQAAGATAASAAGCTAGVSGSLRDRIIERQGAKIMADTEETSRARRK